MSKNNIIQKAKWNVGDTKVYQGVTYVVGALNAKGAPLWRKADKKQSAQQPQPSATPKQPINQPAQQPPTAQPTQQPSTTPKPQPQKSAPYDAPKPKIVYKKQPAKEIAVEARVPETFVLRSKKTGKDEQKERSKYRQAYSNLPDDKLLNILNSLNMAWELRTIAYEDAQRRGIPEDKVDISGSLERRWKSLKNQYDIFNSSDDNNAEEEYSSINSAIYDTFDYDEIKSKFPNGDKGWEDPKDSRIQDYFNKLETKADRQKYDAFLDKIKREQPYYQTPDQVLQDLARDFAGFFRNDKKPMFVSSGGAGAGKSYKFREVADLLGMKEWDGKDGNNDYHYAVMSKDIETPKDFAEVLHKHNGKIIVFDDKDKLLTSTSGPLIGMMKAIADADPRNRTFSYGSNNKEKFTGKLLFITNKSQEKLNKDEDHKAIMSRASVNDIHFTVNENLELLSKRYKTMGELPILKDNPKLEKEVRQTIYDIIMDKSDNLDPMKFTVRKFSTILDKVNADLDSNELANQNIQLSNVFGGQKNWERSVEIELEKGENDDFLKGELRENEVEEMDEDLKEMYRKLYKKNPKKFVELFGKEIINAINGQTQEETEEEVVKSFYDEIGEMSIEEAENILL